MHLFQRLFGFISNFRFIGAHNLDDVRRVCFLCVYLLDMTSECEIYQMLLKTRFKHVHFALWVILLFPEFTIPSTPNAAFNSNESIEMFHLTSSSLSSTEVNELPIFVAKMAFHVCLLLWKWHRLTLIFRMLFSSLKQNVTIS